MKPVTTIIPRAGPKSTFVETPNIVTHQTGLRGFQDWMSIRIENNALGLLSEFAIKSVIIIRSRQLLAGKSHIKVRSSFNDRRVERYIAIERSGEMLTEQVGPF